MDGETVNCGCCGLRRAVGGEESGPSSSGSSLLLGDEKVEKKEDSTRANTLVQD